MANIILIQDLDRSIMLAKRVQNVPRSYFQSLRSFFLNLKNKNKTSFKFLCFLLYNNDETELFIFSYSFTDGSISRLNFIN